MGLDGQFIPANVYPQICQTRVWLLSIGFTLGYGAMFSKVWRVHRFTTKAKADPKVLDIFFNLLCIFSIFELHVKIILFSRKKLNLGNCIQWFVDCWL